MREAVKYRLITESPLPPDRILFDVRDGGKNGANPRKPDVVADVVICRRSTVESLSEMLETAGVSVSVIGFSGDANARLDFIFMTSQGARKARAALRTHRLLAMSAAFIFLGALPLTYVGARWMTDQTLGEIHAAKSVQGDVIPLYERQALIHAAQRELIDQGATVRLSIVMDELANHLPANSWLRMVRYNHGTLNLQGFSPDPTATLRSLEKAGVLSGIKLDTVTATHTGSDTAPVQFELSATVQRSMP